ncbi:MAG TPA: FGGY family carbohydrate kinase, partial [Gemmatimonadaceae bacterium]
MGRQLAPVMESMLLAGVDFGTQSVRVSIVDSASGTVGYGVAGYPVVHHPKDPDFATQSHESHMSALVDATRLALQTAGVDGARVRAMALDTTGSTVIPVGDGLVPLDDYYLWCDHRAKEEAAWITEVAHEERLPA